MNIRVLAIAAPLLWAAIVFYLHVVPIDISEDTHRIPHADKVVHFTLFAILAFLLVRWWQVKEKTAVSVKALLAMAMICISYGAILEYVQGLGAVKRDSDVLDWLADILGTFTGTWLAWKEFFPLLFLRQVRKSP